jgi:hypothetical protein
MEVDFSRFDLACVVHVVWCVGEWGCLQATCLVVAPWLRQEKNAKRARTMRQGGRGWRNYGKREPRSAGERRAAKRQPKGTRSDAGPRRKRNKTCRRPAALARAPRCAVDSTEEIRGKTDEQRGRRRKRDSRSPAGHWPTSRPRQERRWLRLRPRPKRGGKTEIDKCTERAERRKILPVPPGTVPVGEGVTRVLPFFLVRVLGYGVSRSCRSQSITHTHTKSRAQERPGEGYYAAPCSTSGAFMACSVYPKLVLTSLRVLRE